MAQRNCTLLILTGPPATGKTMLINALRMAAVKVLAIGDTARGRSGVYVTAANCMADAERMMQEWRESGATVHAVEMLPTWRR